MVFIAECLWGDNWPVVKRESSGTDQEAPLAGEIWK